MKQVLAVGLVWVLLSGCKTEGTPGVDAGSSDAGSSSGPCAKMLLFRQWTANPSAVALLYRIEKCGTGESIVLEPSASGKAFSELYRLTENGEELSAEAVPRVTRSNGQRVYVTLLLDFSASTQPVKSNLIEAAKLFAQRLVSSSDNAHVGIQIFDGRAAPHVVLRPTRDLAELDSQLTALGTATSGSPLLGPTPDTSSTDLNGAFVSAVSDNQAFQKLVVQRNADGIVTSGYTVVFTDGRDTSNRVAASMAKSAVASARGFTNEKSVVTTYAVALQGADYTAEARSALLNIVGEERFLIEGSLAQLNMRFTELADKIADQAKSTHLLVYCSPARAGDRQMQLSVADTYGGAAPGSAGIRFDFSAAQFAGGCIEFLDSVCQGKSCGGFNCGACSDATGKCDVASGRCVDECVLENKCSGEPLTNALGYSRSCGQGGTVTQCGGRCIDTGSDPVNCGGCGAQCPASTGQVCSAGVCACPQGGSVCAGQCRQPSFFQSDNQNCGACGVACPSGSTCAAGACSCPTGQTFCDGQCRDPSYFTSVSNCGACGSNCSGGTCMGGACVCPTGQTSCNGTCRNLQSDISSCGTCGTQCPSGPGVAAAVCTGGACGVVCSASFGNCDGLAANGCEKSLHSDPNNCGACGTACPAGRVCVAGGCPVCANGEPIFVSQGSADAGLFPNSVALGDFNRDGKTDLVTANQSGGNASVLIGNGNGTFAAPVTYSAGSTPDSVVVTDFNRDGNADFVLTNREGTIGLYLGNGSGTFAAPNLFALGPGSNPIQLAIGDFNRDGRPDVVTASNSIARVVFGDADGGFSAPAAAFDAGTSLRSVAVADFSADGNLDLVLVGNDVASVLLGSGVGTFGAPSSVPVGTLSRYVAVGDFNGDAKPDLAIANQTSGDVSILLGNGNGTFTPQPAVALVAGAYFIAAGDLNGDGKSDIVVTQLSPSNDLSVLFSNGNGTFAPRTSYAVGANPRSVAVGDVNGDGRPDLLSPSGTNGNVSILLSTCP